MSESTSKENRDPSSSSIPLRWALVSVLGLIGCLVLFLVILKALDPTFKLDGHLPLTLAACIAGLVARLHHWKWEKIQEGILQGIGMSMSAILILLVIGMLIGTWILAGVVPAMIDWGLWLLSPRVFLPAVCVISSIVSLVTGSSWSTAGTVGIALIGVGDAMNIDPAYTAGAVVSGAYFGDKLSPMSETTNLAAAMAGSELFSHIRHMVWTAGPAWICAMIGYAFFAIRDSVVVPETQVERIRDLIQQQFDPGIMHTIPPIIVLVMVIRKQPALPSLLLGTAVAGIIAWMQGIPITEIFTVAMNGYTPDTGHPAVDNLLKKGGMNSVMPTVLLIICAMCFGGVMESTGQLRQIAIKIMTLAKSTGSLIASTILTSVALNILAADQYISIVVPGRMYSAEYQRRGLQLKNLSRALEDGGTLTSPLVPWNSCGAYMATALGVATMSYLPFAFLNLINPLIGILLGITGWTIATTTKPSPKQESKSS